MFIVLGEKGRGIWREFENGVNFPNLKWAVGCCWASHFSG
jgi:hypothetical protein